MARCSLSLPGLFGLALAVSACSKPGGPEVEEAALAELTAAATDRPDPMKQIPIEAVARFPRPGTVVPGALAFSPDGKLVTYLLSEGGDLSRQLFAFDPASNAARKIVEPPGGGVTEDNLSHEEKLRRERMRERGLGITRYAWAKKRNRMLVPVGADLYVQDGADGELTLVLDTEGKPALDARMYKDGTKLAYVQDAELYVLDLPDDPNTVGTPKQITQGARGTGKTHGLAEYIAQEEMSRHHGYWWAKDGSYLAYTQVDETHIPVYRIEHQGKDKPFHEDHGYPFAGEKNAVVKLGIVNAGGGKTRWLDTTLPDETDPTDVYLARVHPMPDGSVFAEIENREQTALHLVRFDQKTGARSEVLRETSEVWINLHHDFHAIEEGELSGHFVWASERTGFKHLYLYKNDGTLVRALTASDEASPWMVDGVNKVDEKNGIVYFSATRDGPTQRHLYAVALAGGEIRKITEAAGSHGVVIDEDATRFLDIHSALDTQPNVTLRNLADGALIATVYDTVDPVVGELGLRPPRLVTLDTADGVTLHGALYEPNDLGKPWRTIVSVYGGPHAQRVTNSFGMTVDMRAQHLRQQGFLVFVLDNRGAARRGLAFEGALKHDMGNIEVQDQVEGVRWLVANGLTDPNRVGIYGWSYGGYMSAMALVRAPDTFKVGVAGAPVTHWDGYDTHYTERYMGTPQSNPDGYLQSSVMHHAAALRGKLMLVHGMIDENVHFRHSARLINALITHRKEYELLPFPDERHMPRREEDRVFMEERIVEFFQLHL